MVHVFYIRATNGRTMKKKYELVAPNVGRTVFKLSIFPNEFECLSIALATIQTHEIIS
jgi:hypothetical protein